MNKKIILAILGAFCMTANAQEATETVIENYVSNPDMKSFFRKKMAADNKENNVLTASFDHYTFKVPADESAIIDQLVEDVKATAVGAYNVYEKAANEKETYNRMLSVDISDDVRYGHMKNHNYLMLAFHSLADTLRRHAYLLDWCDLGNAVEGDIYKVYGLDPQKRGNVIASKNATYVQFLPNGEIRTNGSGTTTTTTSTTTSTTTVPDIKDIQDILIKKTGNSKVVYVNGNEIGTLSTDSTVVENDSDFIKEFMRLYHLFINVTGNAPFDKPRDEAVLRTAVLNRIDNLARQHGSKLTMKSQCDMCIKYLKLMKKPEGVIIDKHIYPMDEYINIIIKRFKEIRKTL